MNNDDQILAQLLGFFSPSVAVVTDAPIAPKAPKARAAAPSGGILIEDVRLYRLLLQEKLDLRPDFPVPLVGQDREERAWRAATGPKAALRAWLAGLENAAVAAWIQDEAGRAALSALAVRCVSSVELGRLAWAAQTTDRVDGGVVSAKLLRCIEEIRALPELLGPPEESSVSDAVVCLPDRKYTSADPNVAQALAVFKRYSETIDEALSIYC
jgi:hypothetical protein